MCFKKQEHTVSETHQFYFQQLIWTVAIIFGSPSAVEEFGELVCVSLLSTHCVYMHHYAHDFIHYYGLFFCLSYTYTTLHFRLSQPSVTSSLWSPVQ